MKDKEPLSICLVEGVEELILASAPFGNVSVGDLVELEASDDEVYRVIQMFGCLVTEESSDYRFLCEAHGADICKIKRVYRPVWKKEDEDAGQS